MGMFSDYEVDCLFERDFPYGVPCDEWECANGEKVLVDNMSTTHIIHCMKLVGEDDDWFPFFQNVLEKRVPYEI